MVESSLIQHSQRQGLRTYIVKVEPVNREQQAILSHVFCQSVYDGAEKPIEFFHAARVGFLYK